MFARARTVAVPAVAIALALLIAFSWPAAAQRQRPGAASPLRVRALQIEVEYAGTGRQLGELSTCEGLTLRVGDRVRLSMVGVGYGGGPLATRFSVLDPPGFLSLSGAAEQRGQVVVTARKASLYGRSSIALLGWELVGDVLLEGLYPKGAIPVEILPTAVERPTQPTSARELVRLLYRAILLRDPDPQGAAPRIEDIEVEGLAAVVTHARSIAQSPESLEEIPARKIAKERRLESLFAELLGLGPDEVDPLTWERLLRAVEEGRIADVAEELVRSRQFQVRHGITADFRRR